jgi:hypothetical protein
MSFAALSRCVPTIGPGCESAPLTVIELLTVEVTFFCELSVDVGPTGN